MKQAKNGDTVKVHYTGKLGNGKIFDSSAKRDPLQFKIGDGQIILGFEQAVVGMKPGETKTTKIPSEKAYGPYSEEFVLVVDRSKIPSNIEPEVGQQYQVPQENGQKPVFMVTEVTESNVTLDGNHPLTGKDLTFDIQLIEIL